MISAALPMPIRGLTKDDFDYIISVLDQWWGGPGGRRVDPMFFYEFGEHALVAEQDGQVIGFLLGVLVPGPAATGFIHLVGIHPDHRRRGVGKALYEQFTKRCRAAGMKRIKSTSVVGHEGSLRFHEAMGFVSEEVSDYAGPGRSRLVFTKAL
jgi:GNAT superfamily N-acetyltransferase